MTGLGWADGEEFPASSVRFSCICPLNIIVSLPFLSFFFFLTYRSRQYYFFLTFFFLYLLLLPSSGDGLPAIDFLFFSFLFLFFFFFFGGGGGPFSRHYSSTYISLFDLMNTQIGQDEMRVTPLCLLSAHPFVHTFFSPFDFYPPFPFFYCILASFYSSIQVKR